MSTDAIRVSSLTKYYGPVVGVEALSLDVEAGSVFGFLGANGAGKTTTIRLLLDLLRPTSGSASILGFDCRRQAREVHRRVGYLPSETAFYPDLTGGGYLRFLASLAGTPVSATRLDQLLRRFDVSDLDLRRKMRDYSHGMKRKLGIIQALMAEPAVLILDEPTSGLDPLMIEAFCETIREVTRTGGVTVFLSSHVLSEVDRICDRIGLIRGGRLAAVHALSELRRSAARRVTILFSQPVNGHVVLPAGAAVVAREPQRWIVDARGPLGALMAALGPLPVADIEVEPFALADEILRLYDRDAPC